MFTHIIKKDLKGKYILLHKKLENLSLLVIQGTWNEPIKTGLSRYPIHQAMFVQCMSEINDIYLDIIKKTGFKNIDVKAEIYSPLPDELLLNYISKEEVEAYKNSGAGVYSITVVAEK